jgi:MscS family membrane protein
VLPAKTVALENAGTELLNRSVNSLGKHMGKWASTSFFGLELWRYLALLVILLATFVGAHLVRVAFEKYVLSLSARAKWRCDDLIFKTAGAPASLLMTTIGVYVAIMFVLTGHAPRVAQLYFTRICVAVAAGAVFWYLYRLVEVVDHYLSKFAARTDNDWDNAIVVVIRKSLRIFLVTLGVMIIAQNVLNWNITAIMASAGILGLATAFAAQDTIANFFGTVMLLLDRPFKVGERVIVEDADGPVESIGFRSTRIRTLDGHQVSIPNKQVANAKIQNIGRRPHIRRLSNLTITYDTPVAKVRRALEIVREVLNDQPGMHPDFPPRVFFNEFNDCSLNLIMIAWFHPPSYWDYLQWCEQINLRIMEEFEKEGIEFAFPTTTTYLAQDSKRPLSISANMLGPEQQLPPEEP